MRDHVTIPYDDFETLDVFGPVEVLGRLAERFRPVFYSLNGGTVTSSQNVPVVTQPFSEFSRIKKMGAFPLTAGSGGRAA